MLIAKAGEANLQIGEQVAFDCLQFDFPLRQAIELISIGNRLTKRSELVH